MSKMKEYAEQLNAEAEDNVIYSFAEQTPVTVTQNTAMALPANIQAFMNRFKEKVKTTHYRAKIVMQKGQRVFQVGDEFYPSLPCVVVNFVYENNYYPKAFVQGEMNFPTCYARGLDPDTMVPCKNAPNKVNDKCLGCMNNQFMTAGRAKACKNSISVAVLPLDATVDTPFTILSISPTGITPFNRLFNQIARPRPIGFGLPAQCVEVVARDAGLEYARVEFDEKSVRPLDFSSPFVQMVMSRVQEAEDILLAEPDYDKIRENMEAKADFKPVRKARM